MLKIELLKKKNLGEDVSTEPKRNLRSGHTKYVIMKKLVLRRIKLILIS